ncbi:MAG: DNA-directed RNA polymerase subunit B, partial [Nanoarchaeota archaeon]|nr:DNA-directed RNA polymerase subunit B [Nanoarchaeota archaeon]
MAEVYINGKFEGEIENAEDFVKQMINERRKGSLSNNINVYHNKALNAIFINTIRGRVRRPLIIVKDGISLLTENHIKQLEKNEITWNDLIEQGVVEYIDAGEEENLLVAFSEEELTPEHTHLEISPLAMLGLCTSLVPFGNFTQSARIMIGSKNQKQALGWYASNYPV